MKITERSSFELSEIMIKLEIGDELFWEPLRIARPGAWTGHLATAFWLIKAIKPTTFVELGTHSGNSYSAFCQSISQLGLPSRAFAVDTWLGDEHAGFYDDSVFQDLNAFNQLHFSGFSRLVRSTFDDARGYFADGSIDLLHIDGLHTYDAVKHDFETWSTSLTSSAVVVFHDINVREREFGVWQLWQELSQSYPSFEFHHSEGLGILGFGKNQSPRLARLFAIGRDPQAALAVRQLFASRGEVFLSRARCLDLEYLASVHSKRASEQEPMLAKALSEAAEIPALRSELDRLRKVEDLAREQIATISRLSADATSARAEAEGYRLASTEMASAQGNLRSELQAAQDELDALRDQLSSLTSELDSTRDELSAAESQHCSLMSLARQQSITSQRSITELLEVRQHVLVTQQELDRVQQELDRVQQDRDRYKEAHQQAISLLIPYRLRQLLPRSMKAPLRAIKRALRSPARTTP